MENKNITDLIKILNSDESLQNEFSKKSSIDDMYKFCTSIVGGYTREEFEEAVYKIAEDVGNKIKSGEISEDELVSVCGGLFGTKMQPTINVAKGGTYVQNVHQAEESKGRTAAMVLSSVVGIGSLAFSLGTTIYSIVQKKKEAKKQKELMQQIEKLQQSQPQ